ncbi:MAG: hypothetical protein F6K19_49690 [Cyanothece sp. SIO1E1]|nr:hypothetical protein [Cyanothece sp. SIO1E1]
MNLLLLAVEQSEPKVDSQTTENLGVLSKMFQPTHMLISRTKQIPVQLAPGPERRFWVVTEQEWQQRRKPAFEMHPKLGFYCQGIKVMGYKLEPVADKFSTVASTHADVHA